MSDTQSDAAVRLNIIDLGGEGARDAFADDVRRGLTSEPKFLPPKYFYDALGSHLFEAICLLPEYYLTRAEDEIFAARARDIARAAGAGETTITLVELGSGSATKTRRVIDALLDAQPELLYVPVDISRAALEASAHTLLQSYPRLRVRAYAGDYDSALPRLLEGVDAHSRALVLFLGSNIGNFDRTAARDMMHALRRGLRTGGRLLLGADLRKERAVLEAAYDDALGVTAAFNLNILARINRDLGADFRVRDFRHVAFYDETEGRVEMHVESLRAQAVRLLALDLRVDFREGERIHTENSYKYDLREILRLAEETGFASTNTWLDDAERFSSNLLVAV
jgi:L-histidine N-alpha-methyltransferase